MKQTTNKEELKLKISQGESSVLQFKLKWSDNDKMAREMVALRIAEAVPSCLALRTRRVV